MANIISATFDKRDDAERAVDWLRDNGVTEDALSIVGRHEADREYGVKGGTGTLERPETDRDTGGAKEDAADMGKGALAGLGVGAGVGALFGLAAAMIPGVGPFITAGALASALGTTAGGAAAGAIVGGASGTLAGALAHWGLNEAESKHYAGEVEHGSTYVGVDLDRTRLHREDVEDAFDRFNGRMYRGM